MQIFIQNFWRATQPVIISICDHDLIGTGDRYIMRMV